MKTEKNTIMGVHAAPARPNPRGFLIVAILLSVPMALLGFSLEYYLAW